jgi:DNA polymerase elongation subunit (family B)
MRVFLDIETLPPERDELRETHVSADDEEQYRALALDGDWGRVLTVGLIVEREGREIHRGLLGRERQTGRFHLDEARTLRSFWKLLRDFDPRRDLVIGHNVFDFDLPFLYKRSVVHRVRPTVEFSFARYRSQPIYDTMYEWDKWRWGRRRASLDTLARVLGLESSKGEMDGSRVYDEFRAGRHERIARYCMRDVELVRGVYQRMTFQPACESADGPVTASPAKTGG